MRLPHGIFSPWQTHFFNGKRRLPAILCLPDINPCPAVQQLLSLPPVRHQLRHKLMKCCRVIRLDKMAKLMYCNIFHARRRIFVRFYLYMPETINDCGCFEKLHRDCLENRRRYRASSVHTSRTLSKIQVGLVSLFSRSSSVASPERTQIVSTPALTPQAMSV